MNFDQHLLESIGWTLVHSLWQSAIVLAIVYPISRALKPAAANHRYFVWTAALALVAITSITTFVIHYSTGGNSIALTNRFAASPQSAITGSSFVGTSGIIQYTVPVITWIEMNLDVIIELWLIGSALLLVRMMSGMIYIQLLRRNAQPMIGNWEEKVNVLARDLNIRSRVGIAVGAVSAPMVIGYLKPLILFPAGMIAGLSPEQVEAILTHELAHIRRYDFVVNVCQCVIESLLFFNPVIWIISARIRMEREHCCDDIVIKRGIEPHLYVRTLATVEGAYRAPRLALGILGQKHQLLNRMKRVMEKSVAKKEMHGIRILPISLVFVGLVCASWLTISGDQNDVPKIVTAQPTVVSDTSITSGWQSEDRYVTQYFESDEDFEPTFDYSFDASFFPPVPSDLPPFPYAPSFEMYYGDSIPGIRYVPGGDWELFEKEFTAKFKDEFGTFFDKNKDQFEKMMNELRERHSESSPFIMEFPHPDELSALHEQMALINPALENMQNLMQEDAFHLQEQALHWSEQALADADLARVQADIAHMQDQMLRDQEFFLRGQEEHLRAYEDAMKQQLIADGYLGKDEKVNDIHVKNGEVTVNGKTVKDKDRKKYEAIIERFNDHWHAPRRAE